MNSHQIRRLFLDYFREKNHTLVSSSSLVPGNDRSYETICEQDFIKQLHKKMFQETWRWAGKFRKTDKNIGVDWRMISVHCKLYWMI
jgi:fido (protein-threonine AMPylation protein)